MLTKTQIRANIRSANSKYASRGFKRGRNGRFAAFAAWCKEVKVNLRAPNNSYLFNLMCAIPDDNYPAFQFWMSCGYNKQGSLAKQLFDCYMRNDNNSESYTPVPWADEPWCLAATPSQHRWCYISKDDPMKVVYYQTPEKMLRNIRTRTTPGKFLKEFFGHVLSDAEIQQWLIKVTQQATPLRPYLVIDNNDPKWGAGRNPDDLGEEWVRYYKSDVTRVDYSCMQDEDCVRVYGLPGNDIGLVCWGKPSQDNPEVPDESAGFYGRTIVSLKNKEAVRFYPANESFAQFGGLDADTMGRQLHEQLGFAAEEDRSTLEGHRIRVIVESERHSRIVIPYLDGKMSIDDDTDMNDDTTMLTVHGDVDCQTTDGYVTLTKRYRCDCCGEKSNDEDFLNYVECDDRSVCQSCLNDNYTYAYGKRYQGFYPNDECIYCESDGEYYVAEYANNHEVCQCEECGEWYHLDDLAYTSRGLIHVKFAISLDHEDSDGNTMAHKDDTKELPDGTICHEDNYERLLAEQADDDTASSDTTNTQPTACNAAA